MFVAVLGHHVEACHLVLLAVVADDVLAYTAEAELHQFEADAVHELLEVAATEVLATDVGYLGGAHPLLAGVGEAVLGEDGVAEVLEDALFLYGGCLEIHLVFFQLDHFLVVHPVAETLLEEGVALGVEGGVVDGMVEGREDALHGEGEPAAVAGEVGAELAIVACGAEGGYVGAAFFGALIGGTFVDSRACDFTYLTFLFFCLK